MSSTEKPRSLGSKSRAFIPMQPRSVKTTSTLISHGRDSEGQPPTKRFRSSAAPKGTRLASGYVDRAQERNKQSEEDDKQIRLKNLEKLLKDEEIDQATFNKQREELGIGGDVGSTHLVKGLDFKLLERIKHGEDVNQVEIADEEPNEAEEKEDIDVDDELEKALERDVDALSRKREMVEEVESAEAAPVSLSRDEILRQMKERRKNPRMVGPAQPSLDQARFKKLEPALKSNKRKFTESINGRRREVLVITNRDGTTKRKTRWLDPEPGPSTSNKSTEAAWGSDLPENVIARQKAAIEEAAKQAAADEDDDGDIFGGVADYDPLAGLDSDSETEGKNYTKEEKEKDNNVPTTANITTGQPLKSTSTSRNYFTSTTEEEQKAYDPRTDPSILSALKRASQLRQQEEADTQPASNDGDTAPPNPEELARNRALLKKLQQQSGQDDVDMDMSFGGDGRFDDEEEEGGLSKQKLSQWKGLGHEDDEDDGKADGAGKEKRKRGGGKKKKGDKNSFADVMSVLEGRKK